MLSREAFVLVGPTASGKSDIGQILAERLGAAILSADSMLVYQGMDIGTAKPPVVSRGGVPYLGVDLVPPDRAFDLWQYLQLVREQLQGLAVDMPIVVVGGSGLYVKALLAGLASKGAAPGHRLHWEHVFAEQGLAGLQAALRAVDPGLLSRMADAQNPRRLIRALEQSTEGGPVAAEGAWSKQAGQVPVAGLLWDPVVLRQRIAVRVERMYACGLLEEVRGLLQQYPLLSDTACQAIGYSEALDNLAGRIDLGQAKARTIVRTNRLAKRQRTWFRHQANVDWLLTAPEHATEALVEQVEGIWKKHGSVRLQL